MALVAVLMQPATILIDHAHFQYNTVMLGFVLGSVAGLLSEHYIWGCVLFVAALSFKQMALYFAPIIFAYLLGICMAPEGRPIWLLGMAAMTILSFSIVLAPILVGAFYDRYRGINPPLSIADRQVNALFALLTPYIDPSTFYYRLLLQLTQIIHRVFPFARGLFEDKVANIWCCIHIIHKLHEYPIPLLQRISLSATLTAILPACLLISLFPYKRLLPWALASSAWGFFLCSFQVHEKSVLLPLLPITILLGSEGGLGVEMRSWIGWANMLGAWTLFPLLKRDELRMPYFVLTGLWAYLLGLPPTSLSCYIGLQNNKSPSTRNSTRILHVSFYAMMLVWHIVEAFALPPINKPDLWVVLNVVIGTAGFGICYLWCTWQLIRRSGVLYEWSSYRQQQDGLKPDDRAKALPLPWPFAKDGEVTKESRVSPGKGKKKSAKPKKKG